MALRTFCDGRVFGEVTREPPRVLALHGWGRDRKDWTQALSKLGEGAVVLDLPGFGASPPPPAAWGSRDYAESLRPVLTEMDTPVVVVGHSFGGRVALQLAALDPDSVGGVVVSGVPLGPRRGGRPRLQFRILKALHRARVVGDDRMEAARNRYGSDDYRRAEGVMRAVLVRTVAETYGDVLNQLRCPLELVWGADDTAAPVDAARTVAEMLPRARLTEIPGGDHFACFSQPDVLRAALERALEGSRL